VHLSLFFYHWFLNPLRKFPGPKLDVLSQLVWSYHLVKGDSAKYISELHEKYGEVVRTASNELSYTTASAWKEIYGNKVGWDNVYEKNEVVYLQGNQENSNIFFAPSRAHARVRKLLAPAFSERAVRDHEYLVQGHVDQFMSSLKKRTGTAYFPSEKGVADMAAWFNFETFDVLSSLAFGAPIGSLESGEYHPWISVIYGAIKHSTFVQAAWRLKPYHKILQWFIPQDMESQYIMHLKNCAKTVGVRIKNPDHERKDILSYILNELPYDDLLDNVNIIVTAGGDATATTMTSIVYYITQNPHAYEALIREIREAFKKEEDITFAEVVKLKYLKAVIDETMRIHPSVPVGLPRIVPKGGRFIDGEFVPGGVSINFEV
jgi:cytochrome P450